MLAKLPSPRSSAGFGPWRFDLSESERQARCREWRALAIVLVGRSHPLTVALADAIADPAAADRALCQLEELAPLRRRRLLATAAALAIRAR